MKDNEYISNMDLLRMLYDNDFEGTYYDDIIKYIPGRLYIFMYIISILTSIVLPVVFVVFKFSILKLCIVYIVLNLFFLLINYFIVYYYNDKMYHKNYDKLKSMYNILCRKKDIYGGTENYNFYYYAVERTEKLMNMVYKKAEEEKEEEERLNSDTYEQDEQVRSYLQNFNLFVKYLNSNINIFDEEKAKKIKQYYNDINKFGLELFDILKKKPENHIFLQKMFDIYIVEIKNILLSFDKIEDLNTVENFQQYINVLDNFIIYIKNLKNKIIQSEAINLEVNMKTILKELDIDNSLDVYNNDDDIKNKPKRRRNTLSNKDEKLEKDIEERR